MRILEGNVFSNPTYLEAMHDSMERGFVRRIVSVCESANLVSLFGGRL